jgi:gluconate 2-dehydrogenase gamma chain
MSDQETKSPAERIAEQRLNRRTFMQGTGAVVAASSLTAAGAALHPTLAQDATPSAAGSPETMPSPMAGMSGMEGQVDPLADGFTHFSPPDAAVIEAAAARIIPTDDNGPGATEAGVVYFIDRQLAKERRGYTGPIYERGPWVEGLPTQGDQSALSIPDRFRIGIAGMDAYAQQKYGAIFAKLSTDQQDQILTDMEKGVPDTFDGTSIQSFPPIPMSTGTESTQAAGPVGIGADAFFSLLKEYVMAGFFADPVHGGNRDMVGWKLIGFPGAQGFVYNDWILRYGEEFTGEYKSLAAYQQQVSGGQ